MLFRQQKQRFFFYVPVLFEHTSNWKFVIWKPTGLEMPALVWRELSLQVAQSAAIF